MLVDVVLPLGLAFIMLSLGLGLTWADFLRVGKQPRAFFMGALNQVVLLPLAAFLIISVFGLTAQTAIGVMILALCPGGVTSNLVSRLARGDVALSVTLTAVISLVSMFTVPLLLALAVAHFSGDTAIDVNITSLAITMFLLTTVPVVLGVIIRQLAPDAVERTAPIIANIALKLFVIIVAAALATNWDLFIAELPKLGPALVFLNIIALGAGFLTARATGLTMRETKTVAIESGIQNGTLGIAVGAILAGTSDGTIGPYAVASALYGIVMYLVTIPAVLWLRKMD